MTIEILYLTAQMQRWLNVRVARHLEAQAAKFKPVRHMALKNLGADGPGGSVGLDCTGMPEGCNDVGKADAAAADAGYPGTSMSARDSDPVHA